jgi:hypothetical protein
LTEFDAGDLGDRIPFVGRLQRAGQQRIFVDRLRREFGINAGRTEKHEPFDVGPMCFVDDIRLDRQIVAEEILGKRLVRQDATDLGGGEDHRIRLLALHIRLHIRLLTQIERGVSGRENFDIFARETAQDRRTDHARVSS